MTSALEGVIALADGDAPVRAAVVIDRAENDPGAANLEIFGVGTFVPVAPFSQLVVEPAVAFARAGVRRELHVALHSPCARIEAAEHALRAAGFLPCYESFAMCRRADAPAIEAQRSPLPPGWRWERLDARRADAAHEALKEAFRGAPSFSLSPLPDFGRMVGSRTTTWRVLLDGESIAGLVQVVQHAAHDANGGARARLPRSRCRPAGRRRSITRAAGERRAGH